MREIAVPQAYTDRLESNRALQSRGLYLEDPARTDVRGTLEFGTNVSVDVNVIFKGRVVLGDNVRIEPNCILEDVTIGPDVHIKEFSTLVSANVGAQSQIGPYARLRPNSHVGAQCQIGNFVEIKETTMGRGCKINHHSFVGNATLGSDVVIGAGSITCNHDGRGVNPTTIGDGAYVGSGVMMIAPITIGAGAMVAAGSTLTENVPPGVLAICRSRNVVFKPIPSLEARRSE